MKVRKKIPYYILGVAAVVVLSLLGPLRQMGDGSISVLTGIVRLSRATLQESTAETAFRAYASPWMYTLMPIVASLPSVSFIYEELKSRFYRETEFRKGRNRYVYSRFLYSAVSGAVTVTVGLAVYALVVCCIFPVNPEMCIRDSSKIDAAAEQETKDLLDVYTNCSNYVFAISTKENSGMEELFRVLEKKTTVLAGPSGVGKSTAINYLYPDAQMETGAVSKKIKRGKHTTRHSELFHIAPQTYVMDTPGFSSLLIPDMEKEELRFYMSDFTPYEGKCRFQGCVHINEPGCEVKKQVDMGNISKNRYKNYLQIYEEVKNRKRY